MSSLLLVCAAAAPILGDLRAIPRPTNAAVRYTGLERIPRPSDQKKGRWAFDIKLFREGDTIWIFKQTVELNGKRRLVSASNGGPSYSGRIEHKQGKTVARLTLVHCELCERALRVREGTSEDVEVVAQGNGDLKVAGIVYKKTPVSTDAEAVDLAAGMAWSVHCFDPTFFRAGSVTAERNRDGNLIRWLVSFVHIYPARPENDFRVRVLAANGFVEPFECLHLQTSQRVTFPPK